MTEERMQVSDILFLLMRIVFTVGAVIFLIILFVNFRPVVHERSLERLATEMADNLAVSPLTAYSAVFLGEKLAEQQGAYGNGNIERFVRHCSVGYRAFVKSGDTEWRFGYEPGISAISDVTEHFPVAIANGNSVSPATLTLTLYDSWLTRISCLAEKALATGQPQSLVVGCVDVSTLLTPYPACRLVLSRTDAHLCLLRRLPYVENDKSIPQNVVECRYLPGVPVSEFFAEYPRDGKLLLTAVPAAGEVDCDAPAAAERPDRVVFCSRVIE